MSGKRLRSSYRNWAASRLNKPTAEQVSAGQVSAGQVRAEQVSEEQVSEEQVSAEQVSAGWSIVKFYIKTKLSRKCKG